MSIIAHPGTLAFSAVGTIDTYDDQPLLSFILTKRRLGQKRLTSIQTAFAAKSALAGKTHRHKDKGQ